MADLQITDAQLPVRRQPLAESPAAVYLARLAPGSRRTMATALRTIGALAHPGSDPITFPWHELRYQHTQAIRAQLGSRYAPATANKLLAALRGVLKETWRLGHMSAEEYSRAADVQTIRGSRPQKGRALAASELSRLLRACDAGAALDLRDGALLASLYSGGLRRSEAVALDVRDYDSREGALMVRAGKGNKARRVYLNNGAVRHLDAYLELRGSVPGPLFLRGQKGGRLTTDRLTDQGVRHILQTRCRAAGVEACSPHDLRRTFISDLLDEGVDISTVQQLAGHSQVTTTQRYDRRGEATKRRAAQRLHVP